MSDFELFIVTVNNKLQVKHTTDPIIGHHANSHLRAGVWFALQRYATSAKLLISVVIFNHNCNTERFRLLLNLYS